VNTMSLGGKLTSGYTASLEKRASNAGVSYEQRLAEETANVPLRAESLHRGESAMARWQVGSRLRLSATHHADAAVGIGVMELRRRVGSGPVAVCAGAELGQRTDVGTGDAAVAVDV
jgi:hypothetical protein